MLLVSSKVKSTAQSNALLKIDKDRLAFHKRATITVVCVSLISGMLRCVSLWINERPFD